VIVAVGKAYLMAWTRENNHKTSYFQHSYEPSHDMAPNQGEQTGLSLTDTTQQTNSGRFAAPFGGHPVELAVHNN
jgi:hypothetical protein